MVSQSGFADAALPVDQTRYDCHCDTFPRHGNLSTLKIFENETNIPPDLQASMVSEKMNNEQSIIYYQKCRTQGIVETGGGSR